MPQSKKQQEQLFNQEIEQGSEILEQGAELLEQGVEQLNSVIETIVESVQEEELQLAPQAAQAQNNIEEIKEQHNHQQEQQ